MYISLLLCANVKLQPVLLSTFFFGGVGPNNGYFWETVHIKCHDGYQWWIQYFFNAGAWTCTGAQSEIAKQGVLVV